MAGATEPYRLLHIFSTFGVGGPQIRFCTLANALGEKFEHVIVAMDGNFDCACRLGADVSWKPLPIRVVKSRGISFTNLRLFRKSLNALGPTLLLTYNWGALEWALVNRWPQKAPHLHFEDGFGSDESPEVQLRRRIYFRKLALAGGTRIVVPSQTLCKLATQQWGLSTKRVLLIPNGIDCRRFEQPRDRAALHRYGIASDGVIIGTITTFRPEKNLGRLIAAFARLGSDFPAKLLLVGDGPERQALETIAGHSGVGSRIHFTGSTAHPEELLRCFDVFAMSSDTEQMPLALLEAMASGLPIASTDVGDILRTVSPANSEHIKSCRDEIALARALLILGSNSALRTELGEQNRARARAQFDLLPMVDRYKELFQAQMAPQSLSIAVLLG